MKSMAILLAAAAALLAAGCGGSGAGDDGSSEAPAAERASLASYGDQAPGGGMVSPAGITVTGTGSANAVPDVAEWSFGVRSEAESAAAAMRDNAAVAKRLIDALKSAGISNTVHATMPISKAGTVIDKAVAAGANEIYGPNLRVSDSDAQYAQAVDEAFDDARARAEAVAQKASVTLGRPIAIVEGGGGGPIPYYGARTLAEGAADVAIEPGQQEIQAVLTVTFAIS